MRRGGPDTPITRSNGVLAALQGRPIRAQSETAWVPGPTLVFLLRFAIRTSMTSNGFGPPASFRIPRVKVPRETIRPSWRTRYSRSWNPWQQET